MNPNDVFVFGSNEAGRHGAGAAWWAAIFGARWGVGNGHEGQTYAIPTKDFNLKVLDLNSIEVYVKQFISYVRQHPELNFLVTPIGTGLAGLDPKDIAPMFKAAVDMENVWLPQSFVMYL
jgi:hypothetical protein